MTTVVRTARPDRRRCWLLLGLAAAASGASDERVTQVLGNWLTEGRDGIIQISQASDGTVQGRIVGGDSPSRLNDKDPDPSRRSLRLRGLVIMQGLKYEGEGKWSGGTIYDPDSGHTYKCYIDLVDKDKIKLRGYLGISLLGRTQVWTRYLGTSMDLPPAKSP